ncbi:MAG: ECF transporter S component, partial [Ruminococcus sp.]|nr:ECF transporter S component [Ruminococcus sp.]
TVEDITYCCGAEIKEEAEEDETITPLPQVSKRSVSFKPKPLPLWRKLMACVSMLVAFAVFLYATGITDLSAIINPTGMNEQGFEQLKLYIILFIALSVFILSIGRRSEKPAMVQTDRQHQKLNKRTIVASVSILLFIPLTIFCGVFYLDDDYYNIIALLVLLECMLPFVLVFEGRKPKARELVIIAVLCAIGIAGRSLFFMLPQFKPMLALTIIAGVALGGETGFLVGAVTMLTSNMLFSQGPWTPWQMFAMGIIGFMSGVLFKKGLLRRTRMSLATFGILCAVIIYGGVMNPAAAFMFSPQSISIETLLPYYVTGFPLDLIHGFSTALFLLLVSEPMLEKLDRIKTKYGLIE